MSAYFSIIQRFPVWATRLLAASLLSAVVLTANVYRQAGVSELNFVATPQNLPLPTARPTPDDWPSEYGFDGTGRCGLAHLPKQLGYGREFSWHVAVPGIANGSACVWGDLVVVPVVDPGAGRIALMAVHRRDGRQLWQVDLRRNLSIDDAKVLGHATPAGDGQLFFLGVVAQQRLLVFAVDFHGRLKWECDVGPLAEESGRLFSPVLHQNLVVVAGENRDAPWNFGHGTSHLTAVHRLTGEIIWRKRRPNSDSLAKPAIAEVSGRTQLIIPSPGKIASYDPETGSLRWICRWTAQRSANSIAWNETSVFVSTRDPQPLTMAIRADGSGDVTNTHVLWQSSQAGSSLLSPRCIDDSVLGLQENGLIVSLDADSGRVLWRKQLTDVLTAAPISTSTELLCFGTGGRTVLVDLNQRGLITSESTLGADVIGHPIATTRQVLLRTKSGLISLPAEDAKPPLVKGPPASTNRS